MVPGAGFERVTETVSVVVAGHEATDAHGARTGEDNLFHFFKHTGVIAPECGACAYPTMCPSIITLYGVLHEDETLDCLSSRGEIKPQR